MSKQNPPQKNRNTQVAQPRGSQQLRIIGGEWRSRRLPIVNIPSLRPTPDRIRETLFNWLQFEVYGKRCLDLFAGSGALGLEALSRGAAEVVQVEQHPQAMAQLKSNRQTLQTNRLALHYGDALAYLQQLHAGGGFDIIFLDPPFRQNYLSRVLPLIRQRQLLAQSGWLYIEHEKALIWDWAASGYQVWREAAAGEVCCVLLKRSTPQEGEVSS